MKKIKFVSAILTVVFMMTSVNGQQVLKSYEEEYFNFLSLTGITHRNYLNFRTLSDSVWELDDSENNAASLWAEKTGTEYTLFNNTTASSNWFLDGIAQSVKIRAYGPEYFSSYNTKSPFGVNDGALWQGRGYNLSFSAGLRVEGYGFEATVRPQVSWMQNLDYEIMKPAGNREYGSYYQNCDAPQRFGKDSFNTFDWGDTEIRWSWKNFTIGYGTQAVWVGPNYLYPLLLSNNAASFPKFDIGLRRTSLFIPWIEKYAGDLEVRALVGKLTESDYFDNDLTNDNRMYVLFSLSYAVPFIPGLTLGANKVCISRWDDSEWIYYLNPLYAGQKLNTKYGEDQKASLTADWLFEKVGAEFYAEIGIDDFLSDGLKFYEYARYPFHTMSYTLGYQQAFDIAPQKNLYGKLNFEWNNTEPSQDYQMWGTYNFGCHHQLTQGYTNRGQWLGSGLGYGGNSQYLSFTLYSPHGFDRLFIARNNPDNAYIYGKCTTTDTAIAGEKYFAAFKANFYTGFETMWFVAGGLSLQGNFTYNLIINPLYNPGYSGNSIKTGRPVYRERTYMHNFHFELTAKYTL